MKLNNVTYKIARESLILNCHVPNFIANKPGAGQMLHNEFANINYDYENKEGYYKLLTTEQKAWYDNLYLQRLKNPQLNENIRTITMISSLTFCLFRLVETIIESNY